MSDEETRPIPETAPPAMRRYLIYAGVLLFVFLLGLIPMWLKSRQTGNQLAQTERQLTLARLQNTLASAVIDARRAEYEPARQATSQFFTSLGAEIEKGEASGFTEAQRAAVQTLFAGRDQLITLLARSDPAAADQLSDLYVAYRKAMGG